MLALGEPLMSRSPLANVLLRDGDGVPGTHRAPGPLGADFHIAAPPESNTRVF